MDVYGCVCELCVREQILQVYVRVTYVRQWMFMVVRVVGKLV